MALVVGGLGNDTLIGSDGVTFTDLDKLDGGDGNDRIYADPADLFGQPSRVVGGAGSADILDFLFSSSVSALGGAIFVNNFFPGAVIGGFEQVFGSNNDDTFTTVGPGTEPSLYYVGRGGNDTLRGGSGNDTLGDGSDTATDFDPTAGDSRFGIP